MDNLVTAVDKVSFDTQKKQQTKRYSIFSADFEPKASMNRVREVERDVA